MNTYELYALLAKPLNLTKLRFRLKHPTYKGGRFVVGAKSGYVVQPNQIDLRFSEVCAYNPIKVRPQEFLIPYMPTTSQTTFDLALIVAIKTSNRWREVTQPTSKEITRHRLLCEVARIKRQLGCLKNACKDIMQQIRSL